MSKYPRKTTHEEFERFVTEFKRVQNILGLRGYRVTFFHQDFENSYAAIGCNPKSMTARVYFCATIEDFAQEVEYNKPETHARHECCHLLLQRMQYMGECRYLTEGELDDENESIVRRLEKLSFIVDG